jgi:uncharacterized protein YjbI with pentapeptide repeats
MSVPSQRWKGQAGVALASEVIKRLRAGRSLDGLGLGTNDHGVDLSGLPAAPYRRSPDHRVGGLVVQQVGGVVEIKDQKLVGIDFSGARLNGWRLRRCKIDNCCFDRAQCAEWTLWDCTVRNCRFDQANLRGSLLGANPGQVRWESIRFVGSDLRHASAYGAAFINCDFSTARLEQTNFNQCHFSKCKFAGRVEDVVFDGRELPGRPTPTEMEAVDFSEASLVNADFRGYNLRNVVLPQDNDVFLIHRFPCVGKRVLEKLSGDESEPARILRGVLQNSLRGSWVSAESVWVFNRRDWREWGAEELLRLAEATMRQAEVECED